MKKKKEHNITITIFFIILGILDGLSCYQLYLKTDLATLICAISSQFLIFLLVLRYATWKEDEKRHKETLSLIGSIIKQNNEIIKFLKRLKIK